MVIIQQYKFIKKCRKAQPQGLWYNMSMKLAFNLTTCEGDADFLADE